MSYWLNKKCFKINWLNNTGLRNFIENWNLKIIWSSKTNNLFFISNIQEVASNIFKYLKNASNNLILKNLQKISMKLSISNIYILI